MLKNMKATSYLSDSMKEAKKDAGSWQSWQRQAMGIEPKVGNDFINNSNKDMEKVLEDSE